MPDRILAPPAPKPGVSFHAEVVRTGLSDRVLGGLVELPGRAWQIILVEEGCVTLDDGNGAHAVEGPVIVWIAADRAVRIRARAGSTIGHLILGETTLFNAIGHKPEAVDLRQLAERDFRLPLGEDVALRTDVQQAFDLILREAYGRAPGYETVTEAQIRVLLVLLWRNAARPSEVQGASASSAVILQRFRQTVEAHFRDRWTVAQYAGALGVSPDRLHSLCTRVLGRPPQRLIRERTAQEAEALLERSTQTLDQIAAYLGFRNTPHFSSFFKAEVGHPPGAWRKAVRAAGANAARVGKLSYADWP